MNCNWMPIHWGFDSNRSIWHKKVDFLGSRVGFPIRPETASDVLQLTS